MAACCRTGPAQIGDLMVAAIGVDETNHVAAGEFVACPAKRLERGGRRRLARDAADDRGGVELRQPHHHQPGPGCRHAPACTIAVLAVRVARALLGGAGKGRRGIAVAAPPGAFLGLDESNAGRGLASGGRNGEGQKRGERERAKGACMRQP